MNSNVSLNIMPQYINQFFGNDIFITINIEIMILNDQNIPLQYFLVIQYSILNGLFRWLTAYHEYKVIYSSHHQNSYNTTDLDFTSRYFFYVSIHPWNLKWAISLKALEWYLLSLYGTWSIFNYECVWAKSEISIAYYRTNYASLNFPVNSFEENLIILKTK